MLTDAGEELRSAAVVLTAGTFLRGVVLIGHERIAAGRMGRTLPPAEEEARGGQLELEAASVGLARTLHEMGLPMGRLKTGTPPRLDGRSVDWSHAALQPQPSVSPRASPPASSLTCDV